MPRHETQSKSSMKLGLEVILEMDHLALKHERTWRDIHLSNGLPVEASPYSNFVSVGRYSPITYLPKKFAEQFLKISLVWFVFISVVGLDPFNLNYEKSYLMTVLTVVHIALGIMKDAYPAWKVWQHTWRRNEEMYQVWGGRIFRTKKCKKISVGDCVLLHESARVPADLVLLATSTDSGICYLNTSTIIGESGYSMKKAVKDTNDLVMNKEDPEMFNFARLNGIVKFEEPNSEFELFSGSIKLQYMPRSVPLRIENFLLRGGRIYGAEWVLGLAIYVGMDTKIWSCRLSSSKRPSTFTKLLNKWTIIATLCIVSFSAVWTLIQSQESLTPPEAADFLLYLMINSGLVSVAMFLALDLVRFTHILKLLKANNTKCSVTVNNGELNEDLGKVNYVLADKTGTLTENQLELVAVYVDSCLFTKIIPDILHPAHRQTASSFLDSDSIIDPPVATLEGDFREGLTFSDLEHYMRGPSMSVFHYFCEGLALCNTVVPHKLGTMMSTSAEEEALTKASGELGCKLISRHLDLCDVSFFDMCLSYNVVCMKKFSPDLRRMRIIVERENDDHATLYVKGAFSVLKEFLQIELEEYGNIETQVCNFKSKGLRTMVICYREISGEFLSEVKAKVAGAKLAKGNEEGKLEILFQELENEMKLLAVLGIKDMILPETKEAIQVMRRAGVETWVVSGDSESSTLACAYSLNLIHPSSEFVSIRDAASNSLCARKLLRVVNQSIFHNTPIDIEATDALVSAQMSTILEKNFEPQSVNFALSIDGCTLEAALKESDTQRLLSCVLFAADVVVFNNMHPNHKRELVKLLREGLMTSPIVLAVGDDSSDIPMLTESDIGVGVHSSQSQQITYSSDLTIQKFHNLAELILKHGKRNSVLLGQTILLFIHAELLLLLTQLWINSVCDYTPSSPVTFEMELLYSIVFVSIPIVYIGISNNRVSNRTCFKHPNEYNKSSYAILNWASFRVYSLLAGIHLMLISIMILVSISVSGRSFIISRDEFAIIALTTCTVVSIQQCAFEVKKVTAGLVAAQIASFSTLILYFVSDFDLRTALFRVAATPNLILGIFGAAGACLIPSSILAYYNVCKDYKAFACNLPNKITPVISRRSSFANRAKSISGALLNVFRERASIVSSKEHSNFDINFKRATFKSTHTENLFEQEYLKGCLPLFKKLMLIVVMQIFVPIGHHMADGNPRTAPQVSVIIACSASALLLFSFWVRSKLLMPVLMFAGLFVVVNAAIDVAMGSTTVLIYFSVTIGLLLLLREKWLYNLAVSLLSTILLILVVIINISHDENRLVKYKVVEAVGGVILQIMATLISAVASYHIAIRQRVEFALIKQTGEKVSISDNILKCLLPEFVQKRVKDGIRYIAEDQGSVTVIFIEICDFDEICAAYSPSEMLILLDDIFQKIDLLCQSVRVAKIETVGKVYLACSGLRDFELEVSGEVSHIPHARRALELSFAILSTFKSYHLVTNKLLQFKIGVNTGEVVAGVVGFHKPQFSLVGDTINTASRVCTTIKTPNTIHISESTSAALGYNDGYLLSPMVVTAKGKGEMNLFSVKEIKRRISEKLHAKSTAPSSEESTPVSRRNSLKFNPWLRFSLLSSAEMGDLYSKADRELVEKVKLYNCKESQLENSFRTQGANECFSRIRLGMRCYIFGMFVLFLWRIADCATFGEEKDIAICGIYFVLLLVAIVSRLFVQQFHSKPVFPWFGVSGFVITAFTVTVDSHLDEAFPAPIVAHILFILLLMMFYCSGGLFHHCIIAAVFVICPWAVLELMEDNWQSVVLFFLLNTVQHGLCLYYNEKTERSFFNFSKLAKREIEKTERLLTNMLPIQAYESLKRGEWTNDRLLDVTVLYADISGFTKWSSTKTPQEVIEKLSKIFTGFDRACVQKGLYKVHTIGDCYVALGATSNGPLRNPSEEAVKMTEFAFEMVEIVKGICAEDQDDLNMRIGLHIGEVIAGITGTQAVRYDVYGEDVLVANKTESNGRVGSVNVSRELKEMLEKAVPGGFVFETNKSVEVAEVGRTVEFYFVRKAEESDEGSNA